MEYFYKTIANAKNKSIVYFEMAVSFLRSHNCQLNIILIISTEKSTSKMKAKDFFYVLECTTLHNVIKGLQQTIEYQHNLKGKLGKKS
jgi:hypothetical protein